MTYHTEYDPFDVSLEVSRGMRLMRFHQPRKICELDLGTLNMMHGSSCVLGQIYGSYTGGLNAIVNSCISDANRFAAAFGFVVPRPEEGDYYDNNCSAYYRALDEEWRKQILAACPEKNREL